MSVFVLDHPLARHKLGLMRDAAVGHREMRALAAELSAMLAHEATRDLPVGRTTVKGWAGPLEVPRVDEAAVTVVPILRAGLGMLSGVLGLLPGARVGVVGLQRDEHTLQAQAYCSKLGERLDGQVALVIDPMLATAGTAIATIDMVKARGCTRIKTLFLVAAPEGLERLRQAHPEIAVHVAAIDERLNGAGYILPGLGDAGDRIFGVRG
ncbi:uracil phosphoribosyltransferase [Alkalisalibacterium limincola]|uniref:Uracil phosphoribosyltransferase n=1 Tax=Alkalisalibacterium limincola TaxID=2699169 RepID=A0A5C8L1Q5_9GAMM|nr:uracil phosphoribosyltransferase [Alkalisalibacterium limincola]TXK66003.1 uracil phosphoribosyltransferase [Alkalisalibacterium limincola]